MLMMPLMTEGMVVVVWTGGPVGAPQKAHEAQRYFLSQKKVPVAYPQLAQGQLKPLSLVKRIRPP